MKKSATYLLTGLFILAGVSLGHAQKTQTLFSNDVSHGGFGGPVVKFSEVTEDVGVWVGARGGWIINFNDSNALSLGGGGYGLVTDHPVPDPNFGDPGTDYYALIGYGGFELEYTNLSYCLVHLTLSSLVGAGGLTARDQDYNEVDDDSNTFFVFEPGANLEINITSFFRLALGASYRMTNGIDRAGFTDDDFTQFNGTATLKFGGF